MRRGRSSTAAMSARPRNARRARSHASGAPPSAPSTVAAVAVIAVSASDCRSSASVQSRAAPWDLPQLQAARERNIPVYPEVEAASWFLEGTLVGVTGSNGKTTTTSMLGAMLRASGLPTFVGGNIGNALSVAVDREPPGTNLVTELSSFQLEGIQKFQPKWR